MKKLLIAATASIAMAAASSAFAETITATPTVSLTAAPSISLTTAATGTLGDVTIPAAGETCTVVVNSADNAGGTCTRSGTAIAPDFRGTCANTTGATALTYSVTAASTTPGVTLTLIENGLQIPSNNLNNIGASGYALSGTVPDLCNNGFGFRPGINVVIDGDTAQAGTSIDVGTVTLNVNF